MPGGVGEKKNRLRCFSFNYNKSRPFFSMTKYKYRRSNLRYIYQRSAFNGHRVRMRLAAGENASSAEVSPLAETKRLSSGMPPLCPKGPFIIHICSSK